MSTFVIQAGSAKNVTSTTTIVGQGALIGFYVNSTNAGTIAFTDGTKTLSGTITPAIGFHHFPAVYSETLTATIGGTALNVTLFFVGGVA